MFFLGYHSALCFYAAYLHYHILHHLAWDVHRLHEAYYIGAPTTDPTQTPPARTLHA